MVSSIFCAANSKYCAKSNLQSSMFIIMVYCFECRRVRTMVMPADQDSRYDDILRRIAQRQQQEQRAPLQDQLSTALNALNAYGVLDELPTRRLRVLCYGPQPFAGADWAGVLRWYRPRGYYGYQTLTLLGIWATLDNDAVQIILGTKPLTFKGPYYNAESFNKHIKKRFDIYHEGSASPPSASGSRLTLVYDPTQRLAQRAALETGLAAWVETQR